MSKKWLVGLALVVIVAVVAVMWLRGGGDEVPYTAQEMANADVECDAQALRQSLNGTSTPEEEADAVEGTFSGSDLECLREQLPELSDEQLEDLNTLIEQARDEEFDESVGR